MNTNDDVAVAMELLVATRRVAKLDSLAHDAADVLKVAQERVDYAREEADKAMRELRNLLRNLGGRA